MKRSIVLPAYNEAEFIEEMVGMAIDAAAMRDDPFEVIVVDNASTDETASIVEQLTVRDHRVRLIRHPENRRYAASCLTGTRASNGQRVFVLDSDGQHPPVDIWNFDAKLESGCDIVFGWRTHREEPLQRLALSRVLWLLTRLYLGFNLHDVNCGIRGYNRAFADTLEIKNWVNLVNPELFVRAKLGGYRMCEAEVRQEKRRAGVSSHEFGRLWTILRDVLRYLGALRKELRSSAG